MSDKTENELIAEFMGWRFKKNGEAVLLFKEGKVMVQPTTEQMSKKQYVVCSAIWFKEQPTMKFLPKNIGSGLVIGGLRHPHCIHVFVSLTGKRMAEAGPYVEGFITNDNQFLDRQEAAKIHMLAGGNFNTSNKTLYSEDLY